jgi:uncharacterized Zn finger protein (UPF0148 family)
MLLALFGIEGGAVGLVINLLVLFLVVVYLSLIYWTYLDARRRIEDPVLIACATAASVFPFVGTVVYTILRPPEFLEDREERELELRAAELRLRQLIEQSCPHCEYPIAANYLRCPNCERRVRNPCRKCGKPLDPKWGICPYCETEVRKARGERREPTRRARATRRAVAGQRASGTTRGPSGAGRSASGAGRSPSGAGRSASGSNRSASGSNRSDGQRTDRSQRSAVGAQGRPPQRPSGPGTGS